MTRRRAIVMGAICGLIVGPFIGTLEISAWTVLTDRGLRYEALWYPIFLLPWAILFFGVPGGIAGALSAWAVHATAPSLKTRFSIVVTAALIGAAAAFAALSALKPLHFQIERAQLILAASSGLITGAAFGAWFHRANPNS